MKRHIASVHEGKRPFKCESCGATFTLKEHLKTHSYVHTKDNPHKCSLCDASFVQKQALSKHLSTIHDDLIKSGVQF